MNRQRAFKFINDLVFQQTGQYLSDLQKIIFCDCWEQPRKSYEEIAKSSGYSSKYLKQDAGPRLWKLVSDVCGKKVKKNNFRSILEQQLSLAQLVKSQGRDSLNTIKEVTNQQPPKDISPQQQIEHFIPSPFTKENLINDKIGILSKTLREETLPNLSQNCFSSSQVSWGNAPDVKFFYGREQELATLEQWLIRDCCRLVTIMGMGGMGKTHLATKLAYQIQPNFTYVYWKSLTDAPNLQQLLEELLEFLDKKKKQDLPTSIEEQLTQLLFYFKKHKCLIILDNLETALVNNTEKKEYDRLFKLLGECHHQSCILLTTREKPQSIFLMEGQNLPVRCCQLSGLTSKAALKLLRLKGCCWESELEAKFLIKKYSGNPLALKIVCATIQELFEGDLKNFINHNILVFSEIFYLIEEQFNRLSQSEKKFLYEISIAQDSVSAFQIKQNIYPQISSKELIETLTVITRHSLVENKKNQFILQPVVQEYLNDKIIESVCQEIISENFKILKHHALLKAQDREFIQEKQKKFIVKPLIERIIKYLGTKQNVITKFKHIITQLQNQEASNVGYIAGNILNILCQMKVNLTGVDLSNLIIWQTDFSQTNLHNVNLTKSNLKDSNFPQRLTNILTIAFNNKGNIIATGDSNGEICFWSLKENKLLKTYQGHAGWVFSLAFSPDDSMIASASSDRTVKLWNLQQNICFDTLLGHTQRVRCVAFHPSGKILASASSDNTIKLWNVANGQCLQTLSGHHHYVWSIAFNPSGNMLASGSEDRTIKLWEINTGKCLKTLKGHTSWVRAIAFSPDGQALASGGGDRKINIWELASHQCLKTLEGHTERLRSLSFSPNGNLLASASSDHTIKLWNYQTGQLIKTLHGHSSRLGAVAFHPQGQVLASAGEDRAIKLWDIFSYQCLKTWQGYASWIQSVAFSPDGQQLVSGSENRQIKLWHLHQQKPFSQTFLGHQGWVCAVTFSPDGKFLASASSDYTIRLWDVNQQKCLYTFKGHTRWIRTVAFSPDGQQLVSGSGDYTIKLWDITNTKYLDTWYGHTGWIWSVVFSPDGQTVASASEDKTIRLWDKTTGKVTRILKKHSSWVQSVAFSPDGHTLASGSCDHTIILWKVNTGKYLNVLRGHSSWVQSVTFSPDGTTLASGSCDGTIKLWDVKTGQCQQTFFGHKSWVWSVAFSPDGHTLASGSQDENVKLWNIETGECLKTLREKRPLEGTKIADITGVTEAQIQTFKALGAM